MHKRSPRRVARVCALAAVLLAWLTIAPLAAQESAAGAKVRAFTSELVERLSKAAPQRAALAIADFDTPGEAAARLNLGFAVSEIITEAVQRSGRFTVIEKKQLEQIVRTLELQESGLYDSNKVATIGKLINAEYLMVGSVAELAGFYRISVRVVAVESGSIVVSDSVELDTELVENAAEKYQPPKYRLMIGSSMSWFALTPEGLGTYSIGLQLGASYAIARDQWLWLQTIYFFWHYGIHDDFVDATTSTNANYTLVNTFIVLAGYGYRFPLSRAISIQPSLSAGAVIGGLNASQTFTDINPPYTTELFEPRSVWASPALEARVDLVFLERSPISFYIGTGYFVYTKRLEESYRTLSTDLLISGIKLEGAVMFYF